MEILLEILFGLAGGLTARWLLPRIFGGRIQVLPTPLPRSWWSLRIHTRLPNGQIGIDPEAATFFRGDILDDAGYWRNLFVLFVSKARCALGLNREPNLDCQRAGDRRTNLHGIVP
jgi:hypothetical protein